MLRLLPKDDIANSVPAFFQRDNATRLQRVMQTMLQIDNLDIAVLSQSYE